MQRLTHPQAIFTSFKLEKSCAVAPESVAADPLRTISPCSVAAEESMAVASCSASYSSSASDIDDTDDGQQRKHNNNNNKVDDGGHEAEVTNRTAAVLNLPQNHINDANKVLSKYPESFIFTFKSIVLLQLTKSVDMMLNLAALFSSRTNH